MPAPQWVWRLTVLAAAAIALLAANTHAFIVWDEIMALLPATLFTNTDGYVVLGAPARATAGSAGSSSGSSSGPASAAAAAPLEDCDAPAAAAAARARLTAVPLAAPPLCTSDAAPIPGEGGCRDCSTASSAASAALAAARNEFAGPCVADSDCAVVWAEVQCFGSCGFAARAPAAARAREAVDVASRRFCGGSTAQGRALADRNRLRATPLASASAPAPTPSPAPSSAPSSAPASTVAALDETPAHLRAYSLWPVATYMSLCPYMTPMCARGRPVCRRDSRFDAATAQEGPCGGAAWARDAAGRYARRCELALDEAVLGLPVAVAAPGDDGA